ncbi:Nuclease-related domain protein [Paraliobacillus sp. PM-2]|uniref:nuclease-related domain-containing protein n=1 Tax=Paraliobacillus sp. PM-2 TaxID=1462524 RepID=UPI00061CC953|nr:nuclease-related domain-containing protein [Paraliobacillus sp. PM-2]CQR46413.1 Nuclease-related domain protein [Paraliobacillus sp. PM-2]
MQIGRPVKKPLKLLQLEALLPRLSLKNEQHVFLSDILRKEQSGYQGELSLNYFFHLIEISESILLYGLRLPAANNAFQLDALLLTPNAHYVIEAKNMKGSITFNQAGQMIRSVDGISETFQNPQLQINEQMLHLKHFLRQHGFPEVPIHPIICFTHPRVILQFNQSYNNIITSEQLPNHIRQLTKQVKQNKYTHAELKKLADFLNSHHTDYRLHLHEKYSLPNHHIRNGVWCTICKKDMMKREKRTWLCPSCGGKDKMAHKQALVEYALLFKESIKNEEARRFLVIQSPSTVKRILTGLKLEYRGENKAREYHLKELVRHERRYF